MTSWTDFLALIRSDRVSSQTRDALLSRLEQPAQASPACLSPACLSPGQFATLQALLGRVLPQSRVDVASRLDRQWASGEGDGWRFAVLPDDATAARDGLDELADHAFVDLSDAAQEALLRRIASGALGERMQLWFEDLRGQATMLYVADPTTMARMGYGGFAYAGDGPDRQGFERIGPGEKDNWEPEPVR